MKFRIRNLNHIQLNINFILHILLNTAFQKSDSRQIRSTTKSAEIIFVNFLTLKKFWLFKVLEIVVFVSESTQFSSQTMGTSKLEKQLCNLGQKLLFLKYLISMQLKLQSSKQRPKYKSQF